MEEKTDHAGARAQAVGKHSHPLIPAPGKPAADTDRLARTFRAVADIETLKALADPIRLALLNALMPADGSDLPVMSVKELAAELGEPQTKLYRHVKQLEAAGLIGAVSSRLVSGIVEQRYQACQKDLVLGPNLTHEQKAGTESEAAVAAMFDVYRSRFFAAQRASKGPPPTVPAGESYRRPLLFMSDGRVSPAKAASIRDRLQEITNELRQADEIRHGDELSQGERLSQGEKLSQGQSDELSQKEAGEGEGVGVEVLIGFFSPEPSEPG